jgi:hypothetical protein
MPEPRKVNRMFDANALVFGFIPFKLMYPFVGCLILGALVVNNLKTHPVVGLVIFFITFATWTIVTYKDGGKSVKARGKSVPTYSGGTRPHESVVQALQNEDSKNQERRHQKRK